LQNFLEPGERVESDKSYRSNTEKVKCPENNANLVEKRAMQGRVRARHKTLNRQLKDWGILSQVFHQHILWHGNVFWVCVVVTQLTIKNDEPLFEVEYEDNNRKTS
jgi:hypothetical protein